MTIKLFKVVQASLLASWQDNGRLQSTHHGVTQGGSSDCHAAFWANRLLLRAPSLPVIEVTMGMFAIEFFNDCQIAITGADLDVRLNKKSIPNWQSLLVKKGDVLSYAAAKNGVRAYLAINAEVDLKKNFGSASCVSRECAAGVSNQTLGVGDIVMGRPAIECVKRIVPQRYVPNYQQALILQLIAGYQFDQFSPESIKTLLSSEYQISPNSSRMAVLLEGDRLQHNSESLASEGIAYGAVQVPPSGQPVILMNDRQTMGGYPKPGCISRLSGAALAQRFAPTKIRFELTTIEQASTSYREFLSFFLKSDF